MGTPNNLISGLKEGVKSTGKYVKKHPFKTMAISIVLLLLMVVTLFLMTYFGAFGPIPTQSELKALKNPVTSTIYGRDKKPIGTYYFQNRTNIDSAQLTPELVNALVATEDARFYTHRGIDYKSYARVLVKSVIMGKETGGGSTITQQIAKNLFGRKKQKFLSTPINKIREIVIARRLENLYSKNELILLYFNTVSFGENLYGIEKASMRFFNKSPQELTLIESATLVGLLKAPTFYNPRNHPQRAEGRRNTVLQQMLKYGYIDEQTYLTSKTPMILDYQPPVKISSFASYYKEFIKEEFNKWALENPKEDGSTYNVEVDGLNVFTTLDPYVQKYIENAMARQINRLQKEMRSSWTSATIEGGKDALVKMLVEALPRVKRLREQGKSEQEINAFINLTKKRKYWELGSGWVEMEQSLRDSIVESLTRLHTGILALNSRNGAVMGYLGGIDYGYSQKDHIHDRKQVGSVFKPITYLAALNAGESPCNFYNNTLRKYAKFEDWTPRNVDHRYGGSYSMHGALANSINTVSVELQLKTGNERVVELAKKMGITTEIPDVPSMVLGTAELSLFEMARAYAGISNGGRAITPYIIERIEKEDGTILYQAEPNFGSTRISSTANVRSLQQMMHEVLETGTGKGFKAYEIPFNLIGKTGTTQNNTDSWFLACSPEMVIGSWVGTLDKRVQLGNGSGARTAMPMVASVFKSLSSWRNPILTNFEFDSDYFACPPFSEFDAISTMEHYASDSVYLRERFIRDSLVQDSISRNSAVDSLIYQTPNLDSLQSETPLQRQ